MDAGSSPLLVKTAAERAQPFTCHRCGEVIGVYEPLVLVEGAHARTTSRAAEPDLRRGSNECYHRDCYGVGRHARSVV
jgi:hypothetical protein